MRRISNVSTHIPIRTEFAAMIDGQLGVLCVKLEIALGAERDHHALFGAQHTF